MNQDHFIDHLLSQTSQLKADLESWFYYASAEDLNHKPGPSSWSALECLEHLTLSNTFYLRQINKRVENPNAPKGHLTKGPGLLGKLLRDATAPDGSLNIKFKMKTFVSATPRTELDPQAVLLPRVVLENYLDDLQQLTDLLEKSRGLHLRSIKISSFLGRWFPLSLANAFPFLIAHNQRHLLQAKRAIETTKKAR